MSADAKPYTMVEWDREEAMPDGSPLPRGYGSQHPAHRYDSEDLRLRATVELADRAERAEAEVEKWKVQAAMNLVNDAQRDREAALKAEVEVLRVQWAAMKTARDRIISDLDAARDERDAATKELGDVLENLDLKSLNDSLDAARADVARLREALEDQTRWFRSLYETAEEVHRDLYDSDQQAPVGEVREELVVRSYRALAEHFTTPPRWSAWDAALAGTPSGEPVCTTCGKSKDGNVYCSNGFHFAPSGEPSERDMRVAEAVREATIREANRWCGHRYVDASNMAATCIANVDLAAVVKGVR